MEEQTTTEAPVDIGAAEAAQPVQADQAPAAMTTEPEQPAQETKSEPSDDEQLAKFAATKGIELDSDNARKAVKMAMEAEKNMHRATGRATELEKTMTAKSDESAEQLAEVTGQDPEALKRVQRLEVKSAIRDFWDDNPGAMRYKDEMAKLATESGLYGSPEAILKASYAMALAQDQGATRSQVKKEALQNFAHKQQAAVPAGNATNPGVTPKEKPFQELSIKEMEAKLGFVRN